MEETKIIAHEISSDYFMWHKDILTFTMEISSLPENFNPQSQIWNDSCDAGFRMVGRRTGQKIIFVHEDTVRDDEGDIQYYIFKADPGINKRIISTTIYLHIFND